MTYFSCFNASSTALAYTVPCPTNICVETFIPTGVATWEVLRGCHANMIGSNSNFGSTVTGVTTTTRKCTQMKIDGRGDVSSNKTKQLENTLECSQLLHEY